MGSQPDSHAERYQRLRRLYETDRRNTRLRRDCLDAAVAAGDYEYARDEADLALAAAPGDPTALFDAATARIGLREYPLARDLLERLQALDPVPPAVRTNLALCHYCLRDYEAASRAAVQAYGDGARDAATLRVLVSSYHHLGKVDEARAIADDNDAAARGDGALAGTYALLYLDADDARSAFRWARAALARNPDSLDALVVDATVATAQMDVARAERQYTRVLELAPRSGRAHLGLGSLAMLNQDFAGAKQHVARALDEMGGHVGTWHLMAWAQMMSGDLGEADKALQQALELDRNFAETHGALAAVAALRGDRAAAERCIAVARRLDSASLAAIFAQSVLDRSAGEPDKARQAIMDAAAALSGRHGNALARLIDKVMRRPE